MKSLICRITCNEIPNLSYYLQYNTQSYLLQYIYVVLPAMKSLICRITCNAIHNLTCNMILCCIVVLSAIQYLSILPVNDG